MAELKPFSQRQQPFGVTYLSASGFYPLGSKQKQRGGLCFGSNGREKAAEFSSALRNMKSSSADGSP